MRRGVRRLHEPLRRLAALVVATTVAGCVQLGPNFEPEHPTWIDTWNSPSLDQVTRSSDQPDLRQWWSVFNDPVLDQLIADADANNTDIKIAGLRVIEARAQLGIAESGRYPQSQQISAEALYIDRSQSGGRNPLDNHLWQYFTGFNVGWELDFWGRFSRAIESADAAYFAAGANYEDVLVLLHAQIAEAYMALRTTEARLRIARENAGLQKRSLEITQQLYDSGNNPELDVQQAKTQYLGTLSTVPQLEALLHRTRNAVAILLGRPPGPLEQLTETQDLVPLVDAAVLNDVPAELLLRRPDVRAAEWQVASQSALVGVAVTDLYPAVTLLGSIGWTASSLDGASDARDIRGWTQFAVEHFRLRADQKQRARAGRAPAAAHRSVQGSGAAGGARSGRCCNGPDQVARARTDIERSVRRGESFAVARDQPVPRRLRGFPARTRCAARPVRAAGGYLRQPQRRCQQRDRVIQGARRWVDQHAAVDR